MGDEWQAVSAGTKPAGYIHPKALAALAEIDIQHEGRSKHADEFKGTDFDLVVTVCDSAAEECPVWLGKGKKVHHSFPDPALTDDLNDFRAVRNDIEKVMYFANSVKYGRAIPHHWPFPDRQPLALRRA
jgi:arsenate reductase